MQVNSQFMHNFGFIMMFFENMNRYADLASKALPRFIFLTWSSEDREDTLPLCSQPFVSNC